METENSVDPSVMAAPAAKLVNMRLIVVFFELKIRKMRELIYVKHATLKFDAIEIASYLVIGYTVRF